MLVALLGLAALYLTDDSPKSCRALAAAVRRCQFDGCDVILMDKLRRQCALEKTAGAFQGSPRGRNALGYYPSGDIGEGYPAGLR